MYVRIWLPLINLPAPKCRLINTKRDSEVFPSEQQVTEAVLITEDQARKTEPVVREPDALALKEQQNNHDKAMAGLHRGWIGWLVGSGPEKSGNVATLTIFACFLIILIAFMKFDFNTQFESFFKIMTSVFGPVGLALGYLFGAKDSKH